MEYIIIGNIIAFVASVLMVYSGLLKKPKDVIFVQNIQVVLQAVSNLVLGGVSGAIVNALSLVRNLLFYYDRLSKVAKAVVVGLAIVMCVSFNNLGPVGYLPLVAIVSYTCLMDIPDPKKFKYLNIFASVLWLIYDLCIWSFTSAAFDFMVIVTNLIAVVRISKSKKSPAKKKRRH